MMELKKARQKAHAFQQILQPYCEKIMIAGSVRRMEPVVKDIEVVCIPKMETVQDGFWEQKKLNLAMQEIRRMCRQDQIEPRRNIRGHRIAWNLNNDEAKFLAATWGIFGIPVDIFMVYDVAQWGYQLWLRTGPGDANKQMVTPEYKGGLRPAYTQFDDGYVYQHNKRLHIPDEDEMFRILQLEYVLPQDRTQRAYKHARKRFLQSNSRMKRSG